MQVYCGSPRVVVVMCVFIHMVRPDDVVDDVASGHGGQYRDQEEQDDMWLEDFDTFPVLDEMQGDAPLDPLTLVEGDTPGTCPPLPTEAGPKSCSAPPCTRDVHCSLRPGEKCCHNGCVMTCLQVLSAPPFIDWRLRASSQLRQSGFHWLLKKVGKDTDPVDWCSTSSLFVKQGDGDDTEAEDPTLCPHGYVCHIQYPGDKLHFVPNRGQCVRDTDSPANHPKDFDLPEEPAYKKVRFYDVSGKGGDSCTFHDTILSSGDTFVYNHHPCTCTKGSITCNVAIITTP